MRRCQQTGIRSKWNLVESRLLTPLRSVLKQKEREQEGLEDLMLRLALEGVEGAVAVR